MLVFDDNDVVTEGDLTLQPNWRWCSKCQGLFYGRNIDISRCAAGGSHAPLDQSHSGNYSLAHNVDAGPSHQSDWRWCEKCQALYYGPGTDNSSCPGGGVHGLPGHSGNYSLPHNLLADPARQSDWRWCNRCQSLFYGPGIATSKCPSGGTHASPDVSGSGNYSLPHEPFNARNVHLCVDRVVGGPPLPPRPVATAPPQIGADGSLSNVGVIEQPLAGLTDKMWAAGQTLRVKMMGGTPRVRAKVRRYAEEWTQYANIRFEFVDPSQPAEIRVAFDPGGSWSCLGRDALAVPFEFATMNFGWLTDDSPENEFSRVILHEFGHALGLIHEHQSPVGGIQWDREKVYAFYDDNMNWDRAMVDSQVFDKYAVQATNFSQYDRNSIMHYWIPADLTLDGQGAPGNPTLSALDMEYVGRWYSFPVTPANAEGLLRTGDDCDEIEFIVHYGVVASRDVQFRLAAPSRIDWWKAVEVPVGASDYRMLEIQDGSTAEQTIATSDLDVSRPMRFHKAKFLGVHVMLGFTWDVISALPGGSRISLNWRRDRC